MKPRQIEMKAVMQLAAERKVWLVILVERRKHDSALSVCRKFCTASYCIISTRVSYLCELHTIKSPSPTLVAKRVLKLPGSLSLNRPRIGEACSSLTG